MRKFIDVLAAQAVKYKMTPCMVAPGIMSRADDAGAEIRALVCRDAAQP